MSLIRLQPSAVPDAATPVGADRIRELDALRGVALLGIVLANVRQMFLPWDISDFAVSMGGNQPLAWLDWQIFYTFVDLKFITLFSLLFGVGFALQNERIGTRWGSMTAVYLRRVVILALFGVAHGVLLYPAEVLTPYAVAGLLLLAARRLSADNLLRIGFVLLGTSILWGYQIGSLGRIDLTITASACLAMAVSITLLSRRRWSVALAAWVLVLFAAGWALTSRAEPSPTSGVAVEYQVAQRQLAAMQQADDWTAWPYEAQVRRHGGPARLLGLHWDQYIGVLFYFAVLLLWRTLGLFLIGAGLFRAGLLANSSPATWNRVAIISLGAGLPLSLLATWLQSLDIIGLTDLRFPELVHAFSALPLAAGIAAGVFVLHRRQRQSRVWLCVEAAGRMPLTNYIGQSLAMAALAEPWGFSLYGRLGGPALTALAAVLFVALATMSYVWLTRFRMGPLEWIWRCGTYRKWLPNRLDDAARA